MRLDVRVLSHAHTMKNTSPTHPLYTHTTIKHHHTPLLHTLYSSTHTHHQPTLLHIPYTPTPHHTSPPTPPHHTPPLPPADRVRQSKDRYTGGSAPAISRRKSKIDEARDILANIILSHVPVKQYSFGDKVMRCWGIVVGVLLEPFVLLWCLCCWSLLCCWDV